MNEKSTESQTHCCACTKEDGASDGGKFRTFSTGATRDTDEGKFDYEGFLSPTVLERYAAYMNKHRRQSDGSLRASDNWQKGIPREQYMKSLFRHFMDAWKLHRGCVAQADIEEALCAVMFNAMGYLFETLQEAKSQANMRGLGVMGFKSAMLSAEAEAQHKRDGLRHISLP